MAFYEKPMVIKLEDNCEGVYLDSGNKGDGLTGNSGGTVCESIYMNGVYHKPKDWYQETDTMQSRGCEGCPAGYSYTDCRAYEGKFGTSLKPTWERDGYDPNANYKYQ